MPSFRSHASSSSAPSSYSNKSLIPNPSATNSKPEPQSKPNLPTLTTDIRPSRFHEHLDPNSPSQSHLPSYNPQISTRPFIPIPTLKPEQKPLSHLKHLFKCRRKTECTCEPKTPTFKPHPSPQRLRSESPNSHKLRTARLELASKLQARNPKTPLLARLDPRTGLVKTAGQRFAGTGKARIRDPEWDWDREGDGDWKNWYFKPRVRGGGEGIREEEEEEEEEV